MASVYIALLRGVNVSGQNRLPMAELQALCAELQLGEVETYIQSGNIVFTARQKPLALEQSIAKAITRRYGYSVPVLVRSLAEWQALAAANPYLKGHGADTTPLHLTLLAREATAEAIARVEAESAAWPDRCSVVGRQVYIECTGGYGKTRLNNGYLEKRLGGPATTRNWKSVQTLLALAGAKQG